MQERFEESGTGERMSKAVRLSYKFQRLRERIRSAILAGEFQERLPGERELGRLFGANAKTINKALCDLSSEGLLVRQIGRGTFVANQATQRDQHPSMRLLCFMPQPGSESHLQKRIFDAVRNEAMCRQHSIQRTSCDTTHGRDIELSDWSTQARRATDGILCIPGSPLSGRSGQPGEAILLEAHRRRVPIVVLGACATDAKVNAVVPDYVDAGYRLAEHLFRLGCETAVAVYGHAGREVEAVINGCRTAASRHQGNLQACPLRNGGGASTGVCIQSRFDEAQADRSPNSIGPSTGVVLIGLEALRFARANETLMKRWRAGEIAIVAVLDAGDTLASEMEMTSYEVPVERIAAWGVRLLSEMSAGQRPVEVLIPGALKVRNSIAPEARQPAAAEAETRRESERSRERTNEVVI